MLERIGSSPRILVIRLDNIGDILLLTPALQAISESVPDAHITLLASPQGSLAAPVIPFLNECWTHRPLWQDISASMPFDPAREQDLVQRIAAGRFDLAFVFTSFSQSPYPPAYVCYLAGIPVRVGQSQEFGGGVLTHWVKPPDVSAHQSDRNMHLVQSFFERSFPSRRPRIIIDGFSRMSASRLGAEAGLPKSGFIAVVPGATCDARRYPAHQFAVLCALLARRTGLPVAVLGSTKEASLATHFAHLQSSSGVHVLIGRTTVPEFAALLESADLVIANDSAAMHFADAVGTPVLAMFSGTDLESQWEPRFVSSRLLRIPTDCAPCYRFECPYDKACIDISPEAAVEEAIRLLETSDSESTSPARGLPDEETEYSHLARPRQLPVLSEPLPPQLLSAHQTEQA